MSTLEIRQELHDFINQEDEKSLKGFYKLAKSYMAQRRMDRMIAEGEEDVKAGRLYSQEEAQKMIESWIEK